MVAFINGSPPSSFLGERKDLKQLADRTRNDPGSEELFDSTTQELIEKSGFRSDTHVVITSDGYVTELINIINPKAQRDSLKQPPVLLFHGALLDPSSWISGSVRQHHPETWPRTLEDGPITSSNRSLAFLMANNGYDVWLAATRGSNKQNMGHVRLRTEMLEDMLGQQELDCVGPGGEQKVRRFIDTLKYLDFSQDQLVEIEYPKQIDEVLRLTNSQKVSVITYSKATQIVFKLLASNSIHSRRIHSHVALAPILNNIGTSIVWKFISKLTVSVPNQLGNLVYSQVIASSWMRRWLASLDPNTWYHYTTTLFVGPSPRYQTSSESSIIGSVFTGESFTEAKHYCQQILAGKLQKYDYGPLRNRVHYDGSLTPPDYDISQIQLERWMMVSGEQDTLSTPDSAQQYHDLPKFKPEKWIKLRKSNHIDLIFALDNDVTVNLPILEFMDKFRTEKGR